MSLYKLAAIDLDGTLLGPRHAISDENAAAVHRLQASGAHVVLASGRHYNSMRKYADALPGVEWIISCQGCELADVSRDIILSRTFMLPAEVQKTLEQGHSLGFATVAYTAEGVVTDGPWNDEFQFYTDLAGHRPVTVTRDELMRHEIFKMIWMGDPDAISKIAPSSSTKDTQAVRTQARFLEFMPTHVSKATALQTLAARLGIKPSEAVVFGDGENDIPMFEWAGLSIAMPHGWPLALKSAKLIAPAGPSETALARAIDLALSVREGL